MTFVESQFRIRNRRFLLCTEVGEISSIVEDGSIYTTIHYYMSHLYEGAGFPCSRLVW
jgi:hypothetical protein